MALGHRLDLMFWIAEGFLRPTIKKLLIAATTLGLLSPAWADTAGPAPAPAPTTPAAPAAPDAVQVVTAPPVVHPAVPADAVNCGTIVVPTGIGIGPGADVTAFNPLLGNSLYNSEASGMMFQPLLAVSGYTLDIDWSQSLATSITISDNDTVFDVKMRPWVWSDGVPVTTADVAYAWKLIQAYGTNYSGYGGGGIPMLIKELKIIGPEEFQVVLKRSVNPKWFTLTGLGAFSPLPEHVWSHYTTDQIYQNQSNVKFFQVVDGPLYPQALNFGQDLVMLPNPKWPGGKLYFNRFVFKFLESDGASLQQFEDGELDMINLPIGLWDAVQHLPDTYIVKLPLPPGYDDLVLNFHNPKVSFFKDVRVRQAMEDAINQAEMNRVINHGMGMEHWGPVTAVPPTYLTPEMKAGHYPVAYDPAHAIALLEQAGYHRGADGIMEKDGKKLEFTDLDTGGAVYGEEMTLMTQAYLKKIGIKMNIRQIAFNQALVMLLDPHGDWEAIMMGGGGGAYETGELLFKTGGAANSGGYSDPKMDQLIDDTMYKSGMDPFYAYETYASEQQPVIFMEREGDAMLVHNNIKGAANFVDPLYNYFPSALYCTAPRAETH